ncbi:MAG TPA: hypothetical protein VLJ13_10790 [Brevundimonas sp.]|nr:hypothetical protein [Brevundimonas sp.]
MQHAGFTWTLKRDGDGWLWAARGRNEETLIEGRARSRAEGAACLVRAMSQAVLASDGPVAA